MAERMILISVSDYEKLQNPQNCGEVTKGLNEKIAASNSSSNSESTNFGSGIIKAEKKSIAGKKAKSITSPDSVDPVGTVKPVDAVTREISGPQVDCSYCRPHHFLS